MVDSTDFVFLLRHTGLTGGNASSHMSRLEAAGYVEAHKTFVGKRPQTRYQLTERGWEALSCSVPVG